MVDLNAWPHSLRRPAVREVVLGQYAPLPRDPVHTRRVERYRRLPRTREPIRILGILKLNYVMRRTYVHAMSPLFIVCPDLTYVEKDRRQGESPYREKSGLAPLRCYNRSTYS